MEPNRVVYTAAIGITVLTYVLIRFFGLDASCLWFDEIFSVHAASQPWGTLLPFIAQDLIHPPLFYFLLKLWIGIGSESQYWLRLLPAIISGIAVIPFLLIAREFKLQFWQLLISLVTFAVNGSLIKYAQEVRMYSLLQLFSLISIWLFVRYFLKGKNLVPLMIVNVLMVYSHYFGWLVVGSEVVAVLIFQRIKTRAALLMLVVSLVSFLPWAIAVFRYSLSGIELGQNIGWISRPGLIQLLQLIFGLFEPVYYQATSAEPITSLIVSFLVLIFVVAITILGCANDIMAVRLFAILFIVPVLAAFTISWISPYSVWGMRHLIIIFAPSSMILGIIAGRIDIRGAVPAFAVIIIGLSSYAFWLQVQRAAPEYIWCAWGPLAAEAADTKDATVYVFEDLVAYHAWFGQSRSFGGLAKVTKIERLEGIEEDGAYFLPRGFDSVRKVAIEEVNDDVIWIMYRAETIDETKPPISSLEGRDYKIHDQKVTQTSNGKAIRLLLAK
jgi:uncharacterized membrane protein